MKRRCNEFGYHKKLKDREEITKEMSLKDNPTSKYKAISIKPKNNTKPLCDKKFKFPLVPKWQNDMHIRHLKQSYIKIG